MEELIKAFLTYIFPVLSLFFSFVFYMKGRSSSEKAETLLNEITKTTQGWQSQIMNTATDIMSARPEVTSNKIFLAKIEAANKLTESITDISKNIASSDKTGEDSKDDIAKLKLLLDYHFHHFNTILDGKPLPENKANNQNKKR